MKDFAKSIVCNTKAEAAKVGNAVTDKEFKSEADLRRWCMEHNYTYTPVGGGYYRLEDDKPGSRRADIEAHVTENKKTGNALKYTNLEEAKKMCRQINDSLAPDAALRHYRNVYEKDGAYYVMETGEATAKGMKRVGNDTPAEYFSKKPKVIGNEKTGAEGFFKQLSDDVKEREKKDDKKIKLVGNETYQHKLYPDKYVIIEGKNYKIVTDGKVEKSGELTDAVLYGINQTYKKVGNFKTGKSALKPGDRVQSYGVQGTVRKVEGENSDNIYGEPIIEVEWDNGTVKKVGEHYLRKIGNKVGNATPNYRYKDFLITNPEGHEYIVFLKDGRTVGYRGTTSKAQAEDWCDWHDPKTGKSIGNKVGNEASDDKFAYVMREFDEGKLKTPDGKVVTDPAQAKAIAYSESKKTENGLARARNAIKKS